MADLRITDPSILNLTAGDLTNSHELLVDNGVATSAITAPELQSYCRGNRLTEIANNFAAAPNGASLRKASDGSAIEFAVPRCRVLYRWGGTETITNTTSEVNFANGTFVIPAGTLSANSTLDIYALFSSNSTPNSKTPRIKLGGITIFSSSLISGGSVFSLRQVFLTSLSTQFSGSSTLSGTGSQSNFQSLTIDFSANQTLQLTGQLTTSTDTISLQYVELREFRL